MQRFLKHCILFLSIIISVVLLTACADNAADDSSDDKPTENSPNDDINDDSNDDDDDDDSDDDSDDDINDDIDDDVDDDSCDPTDICQREFDECGMWDGADACTGWFESESNCYDMQGNIECRCRCASRPDCVAYEECATQCSERYCPALSDMPRDPPIPGIPGQKGAPPTVAIEVNELPDRLEASGGGLTIRVFYDPFLLTISRHQSREVILSTTLGDEGSGFAPVAHTMNHGFDWNTFYWGYRGYIGVDEPWAHAQEVLSFQVQDDRVVFELKDDRNRGRILLSIGPFYNGAARIATSVAPLRGGVNRTAFSFLSPADERFVGFGERFNSVDQRGRIISNWLEEGSIEPGSLRPALESIFPDLAAEWALPGGETSSYAAIPFYISNKGYGLLADVPQPSHFDLAKTREDTVRIQVEADELSIVVFAGPTPAQVLEQYTERTGRAQTPRHWVFGPWNMFHGYSQGGLERIAEIFREKDIPSSIQHEWTTITPNGGFRGQEETLQNRNRHFHDLGYKSLCYLQPRVDVDMWPELWQDGSDLGHFTTDANGDAYIQHVIVNLIHMNRFNISLVDFTHEGAEDWWHGVLQNLLDLGYDGSMYDFGEYTPPDSYFADGNDGHYWHNPYPLIYQRAGYNFLMNLDDDPNDGLAPDYLFFHRSGYAGSQQWMWAMWGGDPEADWSVSDGLPAQACAGVNLGLSGIPYWGSDTGGFHAILVPAPTSELHKRWVQFSTFSGLMRDMTADEFSEGHRIHVLDEQELTYIVRKYQKLRTQLVPYIVNAAWEHRENGMPLMRAPLLHYPDDPNAWNIKREFLFGPDIYVAPVMAEGATEKTLYLPPGRWIEFWNLSEYDGNVDESGTGGFRIGGLPVEGGREITVPAPIDEIPIFIRLGAVIALADFSVDTWSPANPPDGMDVTSFEDAYHLLHAWVFADAGEVQTTMADGSTLTALTTGTGITLTRTTDPDGAELIVQIVWPEDMALPSEIPGLEFIFNADPLALAPGTWTWSQQRNALSLHAMPGQMNIDIQIP
jgi:alpha-D-xyloside xylohydrolase